MKKQKLTKQGEQYFNLVDACVQNFLTLKYRFKNEEIDIQQFIKDNAKLYGFALDDNLMQKATEVLADINNGYIEYAQIYLKNYDMTIIQVDIMREDDRTEIIASGICGFHYGEPFEETDSFAYDSIAIFH